MGFHSDFYGVGIFFGFLIVCAFKVDFFFMIFFYDGSLLMMMEMGLQKMMVEMKCLVCSKGGYFEWFDLLGREGYLSISLWNGEAPIHGGDFVQNDPHSKNGHVI